MPFQIGLWGSGAVDACPTKNVSINCAIFRESGAAWDLAGQDRALN